MLEMHVVIDKYLLLCVFIFPVDGGRKLGLTQKPLDTLIMDIQKDLFSIDSSLYSHREKDAKMPQI